jgi:hypothetical protein
VQWGTEHTLSSAHNEAGRGMELSELVNYNGWVSKHLRVVWFGVVD